MRDHRLGGARVAAAALLLALAGCSLVYDAGGFDTRDAAPPDGPVIIYDADIAGLDLTGFQPVDLAEGSGCIHDGTGCTEAARAIPVVVTGANIDASATVTLNGAGYAEQTVPATFSADHTMVAFAVRIPPDLGLAAGDSAMLSVTVAQGEVERSVDIPVAGLDDFVASVDAASGTLDVSALDARYASVNIDADVRFTGSAPVRLLATSAFTTAATLDVSGGSANDTTIGAAGPGGCAGAVKEGAGQCGAGGGGAGGPGNGGGGGGHRIDGDPGIGSQGGTAGEAVGDLTLAPIGAPDGSRGNGGGGGGDGSIAGNGGPGGGGGGVLSLTSQGSMVFTADAALIANGGAGAPGTGTCAILDQHGGGGGGGSGGAVLIRAHTALANTGGSISVAGGSGGSGGANCSAGGNGAPGRVRIDVPSSADDPSLVGGTSPFRGIVLDPNLLPVVTEAEVAVGFFGGPNLEYRIQVEGQGKQTATTLSNRTGTATVTLQRGTNRVCVLVNDAVNLSSDEGAQCVTIAYMPQ